MAETWTIDGWTLTQGIVRNVETRNGLYRTSARRGTNTVVATRSGEVWRPKRHEASSFVLNIWLGATSRTLIEGYYDELLRVLTVGHRTLQFRRTLDSGEVRECAGEVVQVIEPSPVGQLGMRIAIEVNVPLGVWKGLTEYSHTVVGTAKIALPDFAPSTAPIDDLHYTIHGPITNPQVQMYVDDGTVRDTFSWTGTIGTGLILAVNSGTWALGGGVGAQVDPGPFSYTGSRYMSHPVCRPGTTNQIELTGTGVGTGCQLVVRGRRSYQA